MKTEPLPSPAPGHENTILSVLKNRYDGGGYPYVLVLHVDNTKHCVVGIFDSLEACLIARCYANFGTQISQEFFYQAHRISGETIDRMVYDLSTGVIIEKF